MKLRNGLLGAVFTGLQVFALDAAAAAPPAPQAPTEDGYSIKAPERAPYVNTFADPAAYAADIVAYLQERGIAAQVITGSDYDASACGTADLTVAHAMLKGHMGVVPIISKEGAGPNDYKVNSICVLQKDGSSRVAIVLDEGVRISDYMALMRGYEDAVAHAQKPQPPISKPDNVVRPSPVRPYQF